MVERSRFQFIKWAQTTIAMSVSSPSGVSLEKDNGIQYIHAWKCPYVTANTKVKQRHNENS